jgi:hypothetical protein
MTKRAGESMTGFGGRVQQGGLPLMTAAEAAQAPQRSHLKLSGQAFDFATKTVASSCSAGSKRNAAEKRWDHDQRHVSSQPSYPPEDPKECNTENRLATTLACSRHKLSDFPC